MKVTAHFYGGPHDGAVREIDAPFPMVIALLIDGVMVDYHYHGLKDGSAGYGIEPVEALHSTAA